MSLAGNGAGAGPEGQTSPEASRPALKKNWRFWTGMTALVLAGVMPLLALLVPLLGLSVGASAGLMGVLVAGGPEVLMLAAAALLGKDTLHYFIARAKRLFWAVVTVRPVSKVRYYAGLVLALVSFVPFYIYGYAPDLLPGGQARIVILAGSDLSFIFSVFLMGGEFWDKLGKLFVWEGKA
jgi:hypothetical protein